MGNLSGFLPTDRVSFTSVGEIISLLLVPIFALAGMIALLFLIWGGFRFLTSRGDPKAADTARSIITSSIIGLLIVIFSVAIFVIVGAALKVDIFTVFAPSVYAAPVDIGSTVDIGGAKINIFKSFGDLFTGVVWTALFLGALVFLAMVIWGGFKYLNSGGDPKAADSARGTITSAIIGLLIIVTSFVIIEIAINISSIASIFI